MQNTEFEEVYRLFLAQIDDYELGLVDYDELREVLSTYLLNALESLHELEVDYDEVDFENELFSYKLTRIEKNIVAKAMTLEWLRTRIFRADLMERDIGDRDHMAIQGDRYLKEMLPLEKKLDEDVRQMVIDFNWQKEL